MVLRIDIYTSEFCGSHLELRENTDRAVEELRVQAEVIFHSVSYNEAVRRRIKGTPSIWINDKDVFESGLEPGIM
jgi:Thioredoxin domain